MRRPHLRSHIEEPSPQTLRLLLLLGHSCVGTLILLFLIAWLGLERPPFEYLKLIGMHFLSGHLGNFTLGMELKYPGWFIFMQSCTQDLVQMLYVFPIYVAYGYRRIIRWRVIGPWIKNIHQTAMSHHKRVAPFGIAGIVLFVIIPSPGTGPVVGAVLGYTLGLGAGLTVGTVITAVFASGAAWYWGVGKTLAVNEQIGPFMVWGIIIIFATVFATAGARVAYSSWQKRHLPAEEDSSEDGSDDGDSDDGLDDAGDDDTGHQKSADR